MNVPYYLLLSATAAVVTLGGFILIWWLACEALIRGGSGIVRLAEWIKERRAARAQPDWLDL